MTQEERRIYLIKELQREMPQYADLAIPDNEEEQWRLLRSLFNVRPPYTASKDCRSQCLTESKMRPENIALAGRYYNTAL